MKKVIIKFSVLLLLFSVFFFSLSAKSPGKTFEVDDIFINAGIALIPTWYYGHEFSTTLPPIFISADYGFKDDIGPGTLGFGAILGYASYKETQILPAVNETYGWKYTAIICAAKGSYHYEFIENFDIYAGIGLGLRYIADSYFGDPEFNDEPDSGIFPVFSIFVGERYFVTDNIAILTELGYGIAWFSIGLSMKL
jgi:hypothetical protein